MVKHVTIPSRQTRLTASSIKIIANEEKEKEMIFAVHTAIHSSIRSIDHLSEVVNRVAKVNIKLHRTKCSMIIQNVIAPCLVEKLVADIADHPFSLIVDESTDISTVKYLCVCIRYFSDSLNAIVVDFLGLVEIEKATATDLHLALTEFLKVLGLNVNNMIGLGTDGANNLCGVNHSLFTLLKENNPKLQLIRCICHSIDNASSKAAEALPSNLDFLCKEIYSWFSHSSLRQIEYKRLFDVLNQGEKTFHNFVQLSQTRWLCRFNVINVLIEHFDELKTHFNLVVNKEKCYSARLINEMLHDNTNYSYLLIVRPIMHELNKLNCLFQANNVEIGDAAEEIIKLILFLAKKIFKSEFVTLPQIRANIDNELAYQHDLSKVDLGIDYHREVAKNTLSLEQKKTVETRSVNYIKQLVKELIQRLPNNIAHFKKMQCFSPKICLSQFSKAKFSDLPFLDIFGDQRKLFLMETQYNNLMNINWNLYYNEEIITDSYKFWPKVLRHQNLGGICEFKEIAEFALTLLSLPISNAVAERVFSIMNLTKTKIRNRMQSKMLNSILTIKTHLLVNNICCKNFVSCKEMHQKFNSNMYTIYKGNNLQTETFNEDEDLIEIVDDTFDVPCISF